MRAEVNGGWHGSVVSLEYRDPEANSSKFYQISVLENETLGDYRVLTQYGRIGSTGQSGFKMARSGPLAHHMGTTRQAQKERKGYQVVSNGWEDIDSENALKNLLRLAGVNTNALTTEDLGPEEEGVTFSEMESMLDNLITTATRENIDPGDVAVETATINAKFAVLREQFDDLESQVEFANTIARSRL